MCLQLKQLPGTVLAAKLRQQDLDIDKLQAHFDDFTRQVAFSQHT